jgi:hypothetical protein
VDFCPYLANNMNYDVLTLYMYEHVSLYHLYSFWISVGSDFTKNGLEMAYTAIAVACWL